MNPVTVVTVLTELLPIFTQLQALMGGIQKNDPEVWKQINEAYAQSREHLKTAHKL